MMDFGPIVETVVTIFSAHSIPERIMRRGDPYVDHVRRTAELVSSTCELRHWRVAYQSRTGPAKWVSPTVEEALEARRSVRDYDDQPLSVTTLSRLLHAAQGITEERRAFRAAPSAGALYPIEIYPVVHSVAGLASGIYHYAARAHALECLQRGDFGNQVMQAGLYQGFLGQAGVCFLLSAVFQRSRWKYHERAYRYVMLEAGHIGQNLYLAATSMGLGACAVGAFYDDQLNGMLQLNTQEEAVLYLISVGRRG
jgi:SagB-type dehydrogenase family enzyme